MTPSPTDPVRELLRAALCAAQHLHGDDRADRAVRVIVECEAGLKLIDLAIPRAMTAGVSAGELPVLAPEPPVFVPGWSFVSERVTLFDGRAVGVSPSRVRLLRLLAEADAPMLGREIRDAIYDAMTTEGNVRYHVEELRKELRAAFPAFEGDLISNDKGYRLELRR